MTNAENTLFIAFLIGMLLFLGSVVVGVVLRAWTAETWSMRAADFAEVLLYGPRDRRYWLVLTLVIGALLAFYSATLLLVLNSWDPERPPMLVVITVGYMAFVTARIVVAFRKASGRRRIPD